MKTPIILLVMAWAASAAPAAAKDTVPVWLDVTPPRASISPAQRYHRRVFLVTIKSSEPGRIWFSRDKSAGFEQYRSPLDVAAEGETVFHFYAEDEYGNRSPVDSMRYTLDTRAPQVTVAPPAGRYRKKTVVRFEAGEEARFYLHASAADTAGRAVPESLTVIDSLKGFVTAVDRAGNRSAMQELAYRIDTAAIEVSLSPRPGFYRTMEKLRFTAAAGGRVMYSFDPSAPRDWFTRYSEPVPLPYGLSILRYFGADDHGYQGDIERATFTVDTVAPRIRGTVREGDRSDTLELDTREPAVIRFATGGLNPTGESPVYTRPIILPHKGVATVRALARDSAGNVSEPYEWRRTYDREAPGLTMEPAGGTFVRPVTVRLRADEDARIFFTLDGSPATPKALVYADSILISREGRTVVRCVAMDEAGNLSRETAGNFTVDMQPPSVSVQIEGSIDRNRFTVKLGCAEPAVIYYETGQSEPTRSSAVYTAPIPLQLGERLRFFAVDAAGNASAVTSMDELQKPMVSAVPEGGIYNRRVKLSFVTSVTSHVFWRLLPDTAFRPYADTISLADEGAYSLEYYSETMAGLRSPIRRQEYIVDLTAPRVAVTVKKGFGDTASIFFEAQENASVYYTLDGTNPSYSQTTRMAGNKFTKSKDRVSVVRRADTKLAFFGEDVAGNQSPISVLDIFKPRAVPSIPAGPERIYDRILSVTFNTFDQSQIYYSRHGKRPTIDSPVLREPVTLLASDTICAFVVDASGYTGDVDTFVFLIDLPPSAQFSVSPGEDSLAAGAAAGFDASGTIDAESPFEKLRFRWDFDGDSVFDTDARADPRAAYTYADPGLYRVILEVTDPGGRVSIAEKTVRIKPVCPPGMAAVADREAGSYCIDLYEWPNARGQTPLTGVSWVEAKMYCRDTGKRLCTAREWERACRGDGGGPYPYGRTYEAARCPTEGGKTYKSGSFPACGAVSGPSDMAGNVWEWVNDREEDYRVMAGGSSRLGLDAHCGARFRGSLGGRSEETGFRCCK